MLDAHLDRLGAPSIGCKENMGQKKSDREGHRGGNAKTYDGKGFHNGKLLWVWRPWMRRRNGIAINCS